MKKNSEMKLWGLTFVLLAVVHGAQTQYRDANKLPNLFQRILARRNEDVILLKTQKQPADVDNDENDNALLQVFGRDMRLFVNPFQQNDLSSEAAQKKQDNGPMLGAEIGDVSAQCFEDYAIAVSNLNTSSLDPNSLWALYMFDAMGKIPSNLLGGNLKWLGNIDECNKVDAVVNGEHLFTGKYCRAALRSDLLPASLKGIGGSSITYGVCSPSRCSESDIKQILAMAFEELQVDIKVGAVQCLGDRELKSDAVVVICILSVLVALVVVGTLYDILFVQLKILMVTTKKVAPFDSPPPYDVSEEPLLSKTTTASMENSDTPVLPPYSGYGTVPEKENQGPDEEKKPKEGLLSRILMSFSFYTNGCKLLSTAQGSETLGAINGIRFLSMSWVILGHSYTSILSYAENLASAFPLYLERFSFSAVAYATVSVDSFFVLSGILVSYLTLKELKKVGGVRKFNWGMFYFHRFWRLTPPYMLVLMVATVLLPFFCTGAMGVPADVDTHSSVKYCRDNWWTNLLYVNNYVNNKEICMGHAWYLANDMQFYIISPVILVLLFYNIAAGVICCAVFMFATITCNAVIVAKHEYVAQLGVNVQPKDNDYFQNIYEASYARMGPYIVGLFTGYLLYRLKCKCRIPLLLNLLFWFICIVISFLCVYGPFPDGENHVFSVFESTVFISLSRTGWGIAVAWIIFACATGNGGWINQLLSWKAFGPLGRLSYCAYLIHPFVQTIFFENRVHAPYLSNIDMIYMYLGHMCLTYAASFVVSLVFESPMMGLEKALLRRNR